MTTLTLSDGRQGVLHGYDREHARRVNRLMLRAGFPRTYDASLIHTGLLILTTIATIDGAPLVWPRPTITAICDFIAGFDPADLEELRRRYAEALPADVPVT